MIVVPYSDDRLGLILQTDHSRVAGLLASQWGNERFAPLEPYASMVIAAQEHDSGWYEWELKPTLREGGHPMDYIGSIGALGATWLDFYRGAVERVAQVDPYAAYHVSMHGDGLVTRGMGLLPNMPNWAEKDARFKAFVDDQHRFRDELREQLRQDETFAPYSTDEALWQNFQYMEVFDQMAQFLCNRYPLNSTHRTNGPTNTLSDVPVPVAPGEPDTRITIRVVDQSTAIIDPYPFRDERVTLKFQGRVVSGEPYTSHEEYWRDFYGGPRFDITYHLVRG